MSQLMTVWNGADAGAAQGGSQGRGDAGHTAGWQPPSETERRLYEAKLRGDWAAYFDVLAEADLFHPMPRAEADAAPGWVSWTPYWEPRFGRYCVAYLTHGLLTVPVPDPVYCTRPLGRLARTWQDTEEWLAINPGTPCEAFFETTPAHRAIWQRHADRVSDAPKKALHALRVGGPLSGVVAHGLGCGALLAVTAEVPWNAMAYHGKGYPAQRRSLRDGWGLTTRADWQRHQESLLQAGVGRGAWEFVLEVRRAVAREYGGAVETAHWRQVVTRILRQHAESGDGGPGTEAEIGRMQQLIGRITRYEARFRADGLLAEGRQVRSVLAWDYGRASNMARWGLAARFCDIAEAERAVIRAGRVSQAVYHSWRDFAAGFVLGRCLHFDEERFGDWYAEMVTAHRVLSNDPESPWLTVPWR